jgi:ABC-type spermidine/putrescine transport system permease subunit I
MLACHRVLMIDRSVVPRGHSGTHRPGVNAPGRWARKSRWLLLLLPALAFLLVFFAYPLVYVAGRSAPGFSFESYQRIFTAPVYVKVMLLTFQTSGVVTVVCLLLGYPYAYAMTRAQGWTFTSLSIALLLPFWVSLLLRTFAWMILLQDTGLINRLLLAAGLTDQPIALIRNVVGVTIGMTHILLPYVVLPLYSVMSKIDPKLMEAASISGARPVRSFLRVFLPLSLPGVYAGALLAFTLGLGFYVTPALLGGPRDTMIGQLIASQISDQHNFQMGSALAIVLLTLTALAFAAFGLLLALGRRRLRPSDLRA